MDYLLSSESAEKLKRLLNYQDGSSSGNSSSSASQQLAMLEVGSLVISASGFNVYSATIQMFRGDTLAFESASGTAYVTELNGNTLDSGDVLLCMRSGNYTHSSDERPLFIVCESGISISAFAITSEDEDYITCKSYTWTGSSQVYSATLGTGGTTKVAKPYLLQKTPWHNQSVTIAGSTVSYFYNHGTFGYGARQATDSTYTELQYITFPYIPGDIIMAVGSTTDVSGCDFIDMNYAGRQWASSSTASGGTFSGIL